ncbi:MULTISPECIES: GntP family permease [Micrococcaceae]|uniref:GntP family permease n=1 Tax=unclassified Kocuria TaxID=2649579 RepID=UPI0013EAF119|nr:MULTISPECIES: SLC13 family permease [unclassified Kocuria]
MITDTPAYLVAVLLCAIVVLIFLINWRTKLHPFLALVVVAFLTALAAGEPLSEIPKTLTDGAGSILGETGIVIFLGAMLGRLLADSGAVAQIADTILSHSSPRAAPWITTLAAFVVGIPMFFEVGLVVLMPVIYSVALRLEVQSGRPKMWYLRILMPAIAALCCLHGMVPPHPGPVIAVDGLGANIGTTILLGLVCAVPTVILSGPVYAKLVAPHIKLEPPEHLVKQFTGTDLEEAFAAESSKKSTGSVAAQPSEEVATAVVEVSPVKSMPSGLAVVCILVPVILMLVNSVVLLFAPDSRLDTITEAFGNPAVSMLVGVLFASVVVAYQAKISGKQIRKSLTSSMGSVASVVMIVAGGGAFNQALQDSGIGDAIVDITSSLELNLIFLGWFIGLLLSFCTGSATAGIVAATGVLAPLVEGYSDPYTALIVIAIGSGTIGLNWVNHSGFWFVKESFGMTLGQATKTHMMVQTLVSVFGLIFAYLLSLFF